MIVYCAAVCHPAFSNCWPRIWLHLILGVDNHSLLCHTAISNFWPRSLGCAWQCCSNHWLSAGFFKDAFESGLWNRLYAGAAGQGKGPVGRGSSAPEGSTDAETSQRQRFPGAWGSECSCWPTQEQQESAIADVWLCCRRWCRCAQTQCKNRTDTLLLKSPEWVAMLW